MTLCVDEEEQLRLELLLLLLLLLLASRKSEKCALGDKKQRPDSESVQR